MSQHRNNNTTTNSNNSYYQPSFRPQQQQRQYPYQPQSQQHHQTYRHYQQPPPQHHHQQHQPINEQLRTIAAGDPTFPDSVSVIDRPLVIQIPFQQKLRCSYGVALFCRMTQKWLCVYPRDTIESRLILSGDFSMAEIPFLVHQLSDTELHYLKTSYFDDVANGRCCHNGFSKWFVLNMARNDLEKAVDHVLSERSKITGRPGHFGFPKGHEELQENSFQSALREFSEETGWSFEIIDEDGVYLRAQHQRIPCTIFKRYVSHVHSSCMGIPYKTSVWIAVVDEEPPPTAAVDVNEIREVRWLNSEECHTQFREKDLFLKVERQMRNTLLSMASSASSSSLSSSISANIDGRSGVHTIRGQKQLTSWIITNMSLSERDLPNPESDSNNSPDDATTTITKTTTTETTPSVENDSSDSDNCDNEREDLIDEFERAVCK